MNTTSVLGGSPMPQPDNLFGSMAEYRALLKQYNDTPYTQSGPRRQLRKTYYQRLPVYLLARCPLCNGRVWEAIDTYSLNGPGWLGGGLWGFGWEGHDEQGRIAPSYHADCHHVKIVAYCLNLNGFLPDDVTQYIQTFSEAPCVMKWFIEIEGVSVVMHAIPISRFDATEPAPRYTAYFLSYFVADEALSAFEAVVDKFHANGEADIGLVAGPMDYDLVRWVEAGRLFWLGPDSADWPLRGGSIEAFPYTSIQVKGYLRISSQGRIMTYDDPINKLMNFLSRFKR
jgi:hypothetical protein